MFNKKMRAVQKEVPRVKARALSCLVIFPLAVNGCRAGECK